MYQQRFQKSHQLFSNDFSIVCQQLKVAVIGLGGVGSWAAEGLARMGVENILLVDGDIISISNTNRQIHALQHTFGYSKALTTQARLLTINPDGVFKVFDQFLTPNHLPSTKFGSNSHLNSNSNHINSAENIADSAHIFNPNDYDFILDCCDDFSFKFALLDWVINQTYHARKTYKTAELKNHLHHNILICKSSNGLGNLEKLETDINLLKKTPIPFSTHCLIIAGAAGGKTRMQDLDLTSLPEVTQDPLLSKLRYQIRKKYKNINLNLNISEELKQITCAYSKQAIQTRQIQIKQIRRKTKENQGKSLNQKEFITTCDIHQNDVAKNTDLSDLPNLYIPKSSLNCAGFGSSLNITATMGFLMVQAIQEKIEQQLKTTQKII